MDWRDHITVNPALCHGKACVSGTRVLVSSVLDSLAAGTSREELLASYPSLTQEKVHAVLAYAAELARERFIALSA